MECRSVTGSSPLRLPNRTPRWRASSIRSYLRVSWIRTWGSPHILAENLAKGFIQPSKSPAGGPILFAKKKEDSLCVDYRGLNKVTMGNRCPLPLIPALLDRLRTGKIFYKIDLRDAYNLVRIKPGDEWKMAFRMCYVHFEYKVMPFGLSNASTVFQHMMKDIFREYLPWQHPSFIFLWEEHTHHIRLVLTKLREYGLFAKSEKCEFDRTLVEFLGYMISPTKIAMDEHEVAKITDWPLSTWPKEVQSFLGFTNFNRQHRVIRNR